MTGLPCSGKSYRTQQLSDYLTQRSTSDSSTSRRTVHAVPSHHASLDPSSSPENPTILRDQIYNIASQEKTARAEEFSAIKRALSKDCTVIADGLNYIKGYRYQLWCEAKAAGTRCCVVHVATREGECKAWNEERLKAWGREDEMVQEEKKPEEQTSKVGKDVMGNLMPESHTAIYGDRAIENDSRSRSSSIDGNIDGDAVRQQDDTMTLKSLYISQTPARAPQLPLDTSNGGSTIQNTSIEQPFNLPSSPLPPSSASPPYAPSTLTSLCMRYEPPSPFTRWDTPLFTIPSSDEHPPYTDIWDAIYPPPFKPTSKKALAQQSATARIAAKTGLEEPKPENPDEVRRHQATVLPTATSGDALQILESTTLTVVQTLLSCARELSIADGDGGTLTLSIPIKSPAGTTGAVAVTGVEAEITFPPGTVLSQPMLQRLRRKYTQIQRGSIAHGQGYAGQRDGRRGVVQGFVGFLDGEFNAE